MPVTVCCHRAVRAVIVADAFTGDHVVRYGDRGFPGSSGDFRRDPGRYREQ
jgi:hypothetical protein